MRHERQKIHKHLSSNTNPDIKYEGLAQANSSHPDTIHVGSHKVSFSERDTLSCEMCDIEMTVPVILLESSGFTEVVYRLYLLGQFKEQPCQSPLENGEYIEYINGNTITHSTSSGDTSYTTNNTISIPTENGRVLTNGDVVIDSTDSDYTAGDKLMGTDYHKLSSKSARHQKDSSNDTTDTTDATDTTDSTDSDTSILDSIRTSLSL